MFLRIDNISETIVVGKSVSMSYTNNLTVRLWQSVMPRRHEIRDRVNNDFISMQIFPPHFSFEHFDPTISFTKWACAAVQHAENIPDDMESTTIPTGQYAVFSHKGPASEAPKTFGYIFGQWLPDSAYTIDNRPHFEVLGEKYKNNDPESEEEIWIPIKKKTL